MRWQDTKYLYLLSDNNHKQQGMGRRIQFEYLIINIVSGVKIKEILYQNVIVLYWKIETHYLSEHLILEFRCNKQSLNLNSVVTKSQPLYSTTQNERAIKQEYSNLWYKLQLHYFHC